jgi:hypothetical protein
METFIEDGNVNTIWIVSESNMRNGSRFHELVKSPLFKTFDIISLFADEAHGAWKSLTSWRDRLFRQVTEFAEFTVLLSGTPFPLGPSEDGFKLLQHFGGPFDEDNGKWPPTIGRAFDPLYSQKPSLWQTIAFRALLAPYCPGGLKTVHTKGNSSSHPPSQFLSRQSFRQSKMTSPKRLLASCCDCCCQNSQRQEKERES